MTKQENALKQLRKAEVAARKAQEARDNAQSRWTKAMAVLRNEETGEVAKEFADYCEQFGKNTWYNFGDTIC